MKDKIDRRIVRTRKEIREAFLALLSEQAYKDITVQDILDRAQINRTTFYKHYQNKQDVARQIVDEFKQEFMIPVAEQRFYFSTYEFLMRASPMVSLHRPLAKLLLKIDVPEINLWRDIHELSKEKYIEFVSRKTGRSAQELDFQGYLYASLATAVYQYCFEHDREISEVLYPEIMEVFKRGVL